MSGSDEQNISFSQNISGSVGEQISTNGGVQNAVESTDEKKTRSADEIKSDILKSLLRKNINLNDDQLSQIVGFTSEQVAEIRRNCYRSNSMINSNVPLSWDYALCFLAGNENEMRKPTAKELKERSQDDTANNDEWTYGMKQTKYFSQIFQDIWERLEKAKLAVKAYRSSDATKMFLIVGITEENLRYWADERDTDLEINPIEAVKDGRKRGFPLARRTRLENEMEEEGHTLDIDLWEHLYCQYNPRANSQIYRHHPRIGNDPTISTIFDEKSRLRIIYESIISDGNDGGAEVTIQEYIKNDNHPLKAVFPLHNQSQLDEFESTWIRNWKLSDLMWCPLDKIRNYFGEPVAFYFGFLSFYLRWLIAPSIVGLIFFIEQLAVGEPSSPGIQIMSFFIIFWNVAFVDFWIRQEGYYRLQWGMTKFQQKAVARPEFRGEWRHDAVTGLWTEQFSFLKRAIRITSTFFVIGLFLVGCVAVVIKILLLRDADPSNLSLKIGLGIANGVVIFICDVIYSKISFFGNDFENHRTEEDYLNALITKSFIFRFFNSFASLFYLAFVRPAADGKFFYIRYYSTVCPSCHSGNDILIYLSRTLNESQSSINIKSKSISDKVWKYCYETYEYHDQNFTGPCNPVKIRKDINNAILSDVRVQLITLFLTAIFIQNFLEVFIPYLVQVINSYRRNRRQALLDTPPGARCEPEIQMELEPYPNTLEDMSELIIQFGYVTLFIIALPITPLLAFLNNIAEMKVDAINLVKQSQRPNPDGSSGIGAWNDVLAFFSLISVATNVAMMTWSTQIVDQVTGHSNDEWRWIFFAVLSLILTLLISFEKFMIPDVPEEVLQAIERQRLIENVLVLGVVLDGDGDGDDAPNKEDDFYFNPALESVDIEGLMKIPTSNLTKSQPVVNS